MRSMKKSFDKAWGMVKKHKEAAKTPSPGRVPRLRYKALSEINLTLLVPTEDKDPIPHAAKTQASITKTSNKRKRR